MGSLYSRRPFVRLPFKPGGDSLRLVASGSTDCSKLFHHHRQTHSRRQTIPISFPRTTLGQHREFFDEPDKDATLGESRAFTDGLWRKAEPGVLADHFRVRKDAAKSTDSAFGNQSDEDDSRLKLMVIVSVERGGLMLQRRPVRRLGNSFIATPSTGGGDAPDEPAANPRR